MMTTATLKMQVPGDSQYLHRIRDIFGLAGGDFSGNLDDMPFAGGDLTAGCENELQAIVIGQKQSVDLPINIEQSNYFKNIIKRTASGETPQKVMGALDDYLNQNVDGVWVNSWVRFPESALSESAGSILEFDLLENKTRQDGPKRADIERFRYLQDGQPYLRIPISYLLRLSLADASDRIFRGSFTPNKSGLDHFLSDNTSPETYSFNPVSLKPDTKMGYSLAAETAERYLLSQLLVQYANRKFKLRENGQKAVVYFAPCPSIRQKQLNDLISDSFYRELFMSPCLSGWNEGEKKHCYMNLCHMVLSRSQLNAVSKLKEAGIINRNLVVLPNMSNISLANNGTHVSLGSRKLTDALKDPGSGFSAWDEKYLGDLVIKIVEHFLPLFVGTYSAAPYRLDFWDFHPEKALGFLPHELDFTHLRMMWRRWKKKANLKLFGHPMTPFGPEAMDRWFSRLLFLKGDFICDYRLIDYLVALLSTNESPALNGQMGNDRHLKRDLSDLGIFDSQMPMYLLYRLREFFTMGFSGFEGRYYSLFPSFLRDFAPGVTLQAFITALAYRLILSGQIHHQDIPDTPFVESERRQIFFGAAIGIPTFFVHTQTTNQFMKKILKYARKTRPSRRYGGYIRVYNNEYRQALLRMIREEHSDLIETMSITDVLADLEDRIGKPGDSASISQITEGILCHSGAKSPMDLTGREFNYASEEYYRDILRKEHIKEAIGILQSDMKILHDKMAAGNPEIRREFARLWNDCSPDSFIRSVEQRIVEDTASIEELCRLIHIVLLIVHADIHQ